MREVIADLARWRSAGQKAALARVISVVGSGPRSVGAAMAVNEHSEVSGSVSGGCVESAVVATALECIRTGTPVIESYGYSDADAIAVGLTCGGTIELFVEPFNW